jgi:hypothetical protein
MNGSSFGSFFITLFNSAKSENLRWQQDKHDEIQALKNTKALEKQSLQAELKKRQVQFEHELAKMTQHHETDLSMLKAQSEQQIRDYKQYLDSIDQLKNLIQDSYSHLPSAVSLLIHYHAKQMLNQMWECEDFQEKLGHEAKLIELMTAVHQDTLNLTKVNDKQQFPKRTLRLIRCD